MIRKVDNVGETIVVGVSDDRALMTGKTIGMSGGRSMMALSHPRNRLVLTSLTPSDSTPEHHNGTAPGSLSRKWKHYRRRPSRTRCTSPA